MMIKSKNEIKAEPIEGFGEIMKAFKSAMQLLKEKCFLVDYCNECGEEIDEDEIHCVETRCYCVKCINKISYEAYES